MVKIHIPQAWELSENQITPEPVFWQRRRFLQSAIAAGIGASLLPLLGCEKSSEPSAELEDTLRLAQLKHSQNPGFATVDRPVTTEFLAGSYNNFYEYGGSKSTWKAAQALPAEPWKVEVSGLVNKPRTYDLDDLQQRFPLEERIYRFRCVEAWSMVLPWIGFPMRLLMADVEPTSAARFVRFTSYYDPQVTVGPSLHLSRLPWPYTEGLRLEEMANDLAFFALGIYGHTLPKQHGAPIRAVLPWKYGFKGAKSIVKIEFLAEQPATFWNTIDAREYDFEANVNPTKPHPRWSQATERFVGNSSTFEWDVRPTLPYNGYGEYVAALYT